MQASKRHPTPPKGLLGNMPAGQTEQVPPTCLKPASQNNNLDGSRHVSESSTSPKPAWCMSHTCPPRLRAQIEDSHSRETIPSAKASTMILRGERDQPGLFSDYIMQLETEQRTDHAPLTLSDFSCLIRSTPATLVTPWG